MNYQPLFVLRIYPHFFKISRPTPRIIGLMHSILIKAETPRKSIGAYTTMTAMSAGWMATMPVETRTGRWYNFSSRFLDADGAKREVEELLGCRVEIEGTLCYASGYFKKPFVKNVIPIGLASLFFEPMAATTSRAIGAALLSIKSGLSILSRRDEYSRAIYNQSMEKSAQVSMSMIYSRYLAGGLGGNFWRTFSIEKAPSPLKKWIEDASKGRMRKSDYDTLDWITIPSRTILSHLGMSGVGRQAIQRFYNAELRDQPVAEAIASCSSEIGRLSNKDLS